MIQKILIGILVVLLMIAGGTAYFFYAQTKVLQKEPQDVRAEAETLLAEVGKLIVLPEGETPTIATVSDPALLSGQPFFTKAKAGDKVLLYTNARKAYLYDPVAKKLLEVAPLNIGTSDIHTATTTE